ncbi:MAG: TonB-dependent receptor [Burkholderiaceae bacterium]|jgi:vitamin B12 transporter|nr:TonB-dependent receptor [Burkholderiaceae bacterium]
MRFPIRPWAALPPVLLSAFPLYAQVAPDPSGPGTFNSAQIAPDASSGSASETPVGTLPPVVVTATRQAERADALLADVTVIDQAQIRRNLGDTVADLLARQPGIQMSRSGGPYTASSIYIRGANSDQMLVLVDGVPVTSLDPSGSALPEMSLADVDHIEIVRGPASTLYGANAVGGVIQIFTKQGAQGVHVDAFAGYGTHDTRQANAGLSAGGQQWRLRVDGFYAGAKSFPAQAGGANHDADADPYRNDGGSASFALLPVAGHELGISYRENSGLTHYGSGNVPPDGTFDYRMTYRNSVWQVYSKDHIASFWNSTLRYGQSSGAETSFSDYDPAVSTLGVTNRLLSWQNDLTLPAHWGRLLVALEHQQQQGSSDDGLQGGSGMNVNSALLGWTGGLGANSWQLNARYDDNSVYGSKATYSAAYGYQIATEWRARASYGTAFKAPTLYQLYAPLYGNPALRPETSTNREIGLTWERGGQSASATWYLNRVNHMIDWECSTADCYTGAYENVDRAKLQGVTLTYDGRFGTWRVHAAYDWLQALDANTGLLLGRRARNTASLALSRRWGAWTAGVQGQFVGARYDSNSDTARLGGYSLINLTLRYAVNRTVAVEGRIDNLFNKRYELAQGYNTPGITIFAGVRYTPL